MLADGGDLSGRWREKCNEFENEKECVKPQDKNYNDRCQWLETDYANDCVLEWETTTTSEPGCCAGDSKKATKACANRSDEKECTKMSSCHWVEGRNADCAWLPTDAPTDPGCCAVSDSKSPDAARWVETCRGFWSEELCLKREDVHGN